MAGRRSNLPIMIGKRLRKGIFAFRDVKKGGYNLCVVWLKKEYESGEEYDMADIDKFDAVLHFCDKESIEQTIKVLQWMLMQGVAEQTEREGE